MESVYETFRSYKGVIAMLPEHQERLKNSCAALGVEAPMISQILPTVDGEVKLKLTVNKDGSHEWKIWEIPEWSGTFLYEEVWKVKAVEGARDNAKIKHGDTSFQSGERELAQKEGFDEILMIDEGQVREGGITNVFFVDGDVLITPADGILPGIGRQLILTACEDMGIDYEVREVLKSEISDFDAMFMCNSVRGLISTGEILPVMQRVIDWCTAFIQNRIDEGHPIHGRAERDPR